MTQFHVVDNWAYHGSAPTLSKARRIKPGAEQFDRDSYKILRHALDRGTAVIHLLS
jgi:excinuclease Cho